jgi:hypothetical protein
LYNIDFFIKKPTIYKKTPKNIYHFKSFILFSKISFFSFLKNYNNISPKYIFYTYSPNPILNCSDFADFTFKMTATPTLPNTIFFIQRLGPRPRPAAAATFGAEGALGRAGFNHATRLLGEFSADFGGVLGGF